MHAFSLFCFSLKWNEKNIKKKNAPLIPIYKWAPYTIFLELFFMLKHYGRDLLKLVYTESGAVVHSKQSISLFN